MSGRSIHTVGLTGGIGSGKTTAAERFNFLGASVLDADAVSRSLLERDGGCYGAVIDAFGEGICLPGGGIDRKKLAALVFSDPEKRDTLNGIVHPAVIQTLLDRARENAIRFPGRLTVLDVPLLFECHMEERLDLTVLVTAPEAVRVARIRHRDGCTAEQALKRIRAQMPEEEKRNLADVVLDNGGSLEALNRQVDELYGRLTAERV